MGTKRIVAISGASTGIGAATAIDLARDSEIVFVHYNSSREHAEHVGQSVEEAGAKAILVQADLTSEQGCTSFRDEVSRYTDHVDVLVNNAGGLVERRAIPEISWALMERVFALNTYSAIRTSGLFVELLKHGMAPVIVNISSIVVRHGAAGATLYGAAKGALDVFTRGMAKELAPDIRVAAIAPGVIETPFHDEVSTPDMMAKWAQLAPVQRNGAPEEIASAIRFVVENGFVHGETIDVNGGMFMR